MSVISLPSACALLLAAAVADREPPSIEHVPQTAALAGAGVIRAAIRDQSGVFGAQVLVRPGGKTAFLAFPMVAQGSNELVAELPDGPARAGMPDAPIRVEVGETGGPRETLMVPGSAEAAGTRLVPPGMSPGSETNDAPVASWQYFGAGFGGVVAVVGGVLLGIGLSTRLRESIVRLNGGHR